MESNGVESKNGASSDETQSTDQQPTMNGNSTNGAVPVESDPSTSVANRFENLLKQTEVFSHFMTYGKDEPQKAKTVGRQKKRDVPVDVNDHRHRRTEEEEDAEFLSESKKDLHVFR